jgi:hypothetical protein
VWRFFALFAALSACHTPRVGFDDRGYTLIDNQSRFFITMAEAAPAQFKMLKESGFDAVESTAFWGPAMDPAGWSVLEQAKQLGLMAIVQIDTPKALRVKNEAIRGHPALLGWLGFLTPELQVADPNLLVETHRNVLREDPDHPLMMTFNNPDAIGVASKYVHLIGVDLRLPKEAPLLFVHEMIKAGFVKSGKRSIWAVIPLQTANPAVAKGEPVHPSNLAELKAMLWLALMSGSRGVFFTGFREGKLMTEAPELWAGVLGLVKDMNRCREIIMSRNIAPPEIEGDELFIVYRHVNEQWFLVYANPLEREASAEVLLPVGPVKRLTIALKPLQAGVFRITDEGQLVEH